MKVPSNGFMPCSGEGEKKNINSELWHACAGPLVSLPPVGSLVIYFPQGHSEQVAASMQKDTTCVPSYPNLPSKLICMLLNITLHADLETDEVYAQMTLQPVNKYDQDALLASDMGLKQNRQPSEFFCKNLTASDTSTHGGFSVPRRAAEKIFPPLDFSMQPPAQEITAKDLHENTWTFRHIYRGQPKRHLLTTGWSVFVSTKRLFAGDSVLFIRDEKSQLLLGIRRANRQQPALSSSVISSDSMHIGILAAAAHAAANNSPFTIFYNPRASPCEFVIPLAKYNKAMYTQMSLGMRFRMMFETEESGIRRYMGTITGISDLDPVRWKGSQWRNLQVGWDESAAGDRPSRVSVWDIEPVVTPFYICPPPFFRPKFPRQPGMPDDETDFESAFKRAMPWMGDDFGMKEAASSMFPGLSLVQWMSMQQQNNQLQAAQVQQPMVDDPSKLLSFQSPNLHMNKTNHQNTAAQLPPQQTVAWSQQLMQNPATQLQPPPQLPPQQPPLQQQKPQVQQQQQQTHHHHQQQQMLQNMVQNGLVSTNQLQNHQVAQQQSPLYSQLQLQQQARSHVEQQQFSMAAAQPPPQMVTGNGKNPSHPTALSQETNVKLPTTQIELQNSLFQRQQQSQLQQAPVLQQNWSQRTIQQQQQQQNSLSEQQLQLHLLQKLQQQQQAQSSNGMSSSVAMQQNSISEQQLQMHLLQKLQQQKQAQSSNGMSSSVPMQQQQLSQVHLQQKQPLAALRAISGLTDGDAPSCSTSPSSNNCHVITPSSFLNKSSQPLKEPVLEPINNFIQESPIKIKTEFSLPKQDQQQQQLEVSSSATSYCLDGTIQQNFLLPPFGGLDSDVQSHARSASPFAASIDGLAPDTLLSRGFDSQKDLQNLLSNYGATQRDIETEISTVAVSSQSFGVPDMSFKSAGPNDVTINDIGINDASGVLGGGMWTNQTQQRMRTYTKVQKRGSVGRSIDVTRYRGYDDLRRDLARMFGIEGQLEDPHRMEWKLVYMDHENDMLLVGDDPWEEFVSNVQSIKILSSVEVQQMSLEGNLGSLPISNQACSGTDSGNAWRGQYDDNSAAASFNR